jgi:transcriptional regulator with XRE-family HTH domain
MLHLKDNVKTIRELSGLSQSEFGKILNATKDVIFNLENDRAVKDGVIIAKIAGLAGVDQNNLKEKKLSLKDLSEDDIKMKVLLLKDGKKDKPLSIDYKDKYIQQLEDNNKFLKTQLDTHQSITEEKEQRIKSLESVVNSLTNQLAEKNDIIGRLKRMEVSLNALVKTLSTQLTKSRASQE